MNETERDRILRMVSEGTLRPNEAAHLLAALAEEPAPEAAEKPAEEKEKAKPKPSTMEVQMQRPDGSHYTMQLPPNLIPAFLQVAKVYLKESARTAAQETWDGLKTIARNKTEEVKTGVKTRMAGNNKTETSSAASPEQEQQAERRRLIIQMVQNGRITASDATRLIEQLDALREHEKANAPSSVPTGK